MVKKVNHQETWKAMEKCVELGLVRSIGLSNFNSKQIEHVMNGCSIKPAVNQVIGLYLQQWSHHDDSLSIILIISYASC